MAARELGVGRVAHQLHREIEGVVSFERADRQLADVATAERGGIGQLGQRVAAARAQVWIFANASITSSAGG